MLYKPDSNPDCKKLVQSILQAHGFKWYTHRMTDTCTHINTVKISGDKICITYDASSHFKKSIAHFTKIDVPVSLRNKLSVVHIASWKHLIHYDRSGKVVKDE
jgi:hypothetical protein